jgi:outer membrane protein
MIPIHFRSSTMVTWQVLLTLFLNSVCYAQINAGADAHSKATTLTHPSTKLQTTEPAAAAPVAPTAPILTWDQAIQRARDANADLHASQATVNQNQANVNAAWGLFLPTVTATATIQKSNTYDRADDDTDTARLNLAENLFRGFGDKSRIDQAKKLRDAAQAAYDLTQAQVSAQLKTSFQNLVIYDRFVKLQDDIISRRQTNLELVTLKFEGGRENKGSVLLSQANLNQAKLDRLVAANNVEAARVSLARVIGEETLSYGGVAGSVPVDVPPLTVDFEALAMQAPELRQATAAAQAAEANIGVSRSSLLPSLDLTASAGRFGDQFLPQNDQGTIALGLTIPLFQGGRAFYGLRAAQAASVSAEASRLSVLRTKIVNLRTTYNAFIEAVEQENVAQSFVAAAETRAKIARSQYNTGLVSFQDWDLIESDLVTRQRNALTSQNNRVAAEAAWEQAQGQGFFK